MSEQQLSNKVPVDNNEEEVVESIVQSEHQNSDEVVAESLVEPEPVEEVVVAEPEPESVEEVVNPESAVEVVVAEPEPEPVEEVVNPEPVEEVVNPEPVEEVVVAEPEPEPVEEVVVAEPEPEPVGEVVNPESAVEVVVAEPEPEPLIKVVGSKLFKTIDLEAAKMADFTKNIELKPPTFKYSGLVQRVYGGKKDPPKNIFDIMAAKQKEIASKTGSEKVPSPKAHCDDCNNDLFDSIQCPDCHKLYQDNHDVDFQNLRKNYENIRKTYDTSLCFRRFSKRNNLCTINVS